MIGNQIIHLVSNPDKMVQEMHRVMKPGAIAYFSVLSDYSKSTVFCSTRNILEEYGYPTLSNFRSVFHLGKEESLEKVFPNYMFKTLGFEEFKVQIKPNEKMLSWLSLEIFEEFLYTFSKKYQNEIRERHAKMVEDFRTGKKEFCFYIRAIFVKKI